MRKGYVQVYTGDGKGKTTAALGLIVRACGAGFRVMLLQFIKAKSVSEHRTIRERFPEVVVEQFGCGLMIGRGPTEEERAKARAGFARLREAVMSGAFDLVVADEINVAMDKGLVPVNDVLDLMAAKPMQVEWVLTGRYAPADVLAKADLVTEMRCVRHYYEAGVPARDGIEM